MFWLNFSIAIRSILRHKLYSLINIFGLSAGLACSVIIILYVSTELSYDKYHDDYDRIYRVAEHRIVPAGEFISACSCAPLGPALTDNFPQIESVARLFKLPNGIVRNKNQNHIEENIWFADSEVFDIFKIPVISGDKSSCLSQPNTVIISETLAKKYFGSTNPIGQVLDIKYGNLRNDDSIYHYTVTAVIKDSPINTHFKYNMLISLSSMNEIFPWYENEWHSGGTYTYIKLNAGTDVPKFETEIKDIANKYAGKDFQKWGQTREYFLQQISKIHMYSNLRYEIENPGNWNYITVYSIISLLILAVGCMNFINLSAVRAVTRTKEVGLRKIVGARKIQLVFQFMGESFLITFLSFIVALLLIEILLPQFNELTQSKLALEILLSTQNMSIVIGLFFLVAFISGIYPAFVITNFKPINSLQNKKSFARGGSKALQFLVITQLIISISLVISTVTVFEQLFFMKSSKLGFDREQKLVIPFYNNSYYLNKNRDFIINELLQNSGVKSVTASSSVPGMQTMRVGIRVPGEGHSWPVSGYKNPVMYNFMSIDGKFIDDYDISLLAGRAFSSENNKDENSSFIINESAAKKLGFENPVDALGFQMRESHLGKVKTIVGVTSDFHYRGMQHNVEPLIMEHSSSRFRVLTVTLEPSSINKTITNITSVWENNFGSEPIMYYFLDEYFDREYRYEKNTGKILIIVAFLGVGVSSLGLLGLVAFITRQRKREIGIRKILGASMFSIIKLLSNQFLLLIFLAMVISAPLSRFALGKWLENYAYHIDQSWFTIAFSAGFVLLVALTIIMIESLRASFNNPTDAIREE